jgi:hypothetical protein
LKNGVRTCAEHRAYLLSPQTPPIILPSLPASLPSQSVPQCFSLLTKPISTSTVPYVPPEITTTTSVPERQCQRRPPVASLLKGIKAFNPRRLSAEPQQPPYPSVCATVYLQKSEHERHGVLESKYDMFPAEVLRAPTSLATPPSNHSTYCYPALQPTNELKISFSPLNLADEHNSENHPTLEAPNPFQTLNLGDDQWRCIDNRIIRLREEDSYSWSDIGKMMGCIFMYPLLLAETLEPNE